MENNQKNAQIQNNNIATELFHELKKTILFQWILVGLLVILLAATNIYHIYQWAQFDTVVVDSQDGGNASYIGQDGDIYNYGTDSSEAQEENQQQEIQGNENQS